MENYKKAPSYSRANRKSYPFFYRLNSEDDFPYCFLLLDYNAGKESMRSIDCIEKYHQSTYKNSRDFIKIRKVEESNSASTNYNWLLILEEIISDLGIEYNYFVLTKSIELSDSIPSVQFKDDFTIQPFQGLTIKFYNRKTFNFSNGPRIESVNESYKFVDFRDKNYGGKMNIFCESVLIEKIPKPSPPPKREYKENPFKY
ncbi:MAG: hypothetical protein GPJ52_00115 [Candidatus Heimdallarchaeota archaeon]|nr:hypothetical protein [Candidatus Heimdallarchaeota archaeon]